MNTQKIDLCFEQAIKDGVFSGAQVLFGVGTRRVFSQCYGTTHRETGSQKVNSNTLFDIASLTKVVSTLYLAMLAYDRGMLKLEAAIAHYLKTWQGSDQISIEQLLAHSSGLPDWAALYQDFIGQALSYQALKEAFIQKISQIPLKNQPGSQRVYSDLGFILLGFILEEIFQESLEKLFEREVAQYLGLKHSLFNPLKHSQQNVTQENIAATENCPWRQKILIGEVHDDNVWMLGGVAGHAGLFSCASDLELWVQDIFKILQGGGKKISQQTFECFLRPPHEKILGWDTVSRPKSSAGQYFSPSSIGHLAFTGCSLWMDLEDSKYIILLTNRVYPHRENPAIKEFRPHVHDLLVETLYLSTKA
ncbi:MAG: serine hydrolase [Deltaproteobacteria bacterium]|nr:serine hydrolase [Deltaproteobacteria bacterium]